MPIDDFISNMAEIGGQGKGWKSPVAIACLLLGLMAGGYLGWDTGGVVGLVTGGPVGALIGYVAGLFLRGFFGFLLIFLIIALAVAGFNWLTGGNL